VTTRLVSKETNRASEESFDAFCRGTSLISPILCSTAWTMHVILRSKPPWRPRYLASIEGCRFRNNRADDAHRGPPGALLSSGMKRQEFCFILRDRRGDACRSLLSEAKQAGMCGRCRWSRLISSWLVQHIFASPRNADLPAMWGTKVDQRSYHVQARGHPPSTCRRGHLAAIDTDPKYENRV